MHYPLDLHPSLAGTRQRVAVGVDGVEYSFPAPIATDPAASGTFTSLDLPPMHPLLLALAQGQTLQLYPRADGVPSPPILLGPLQMEAGDLPGYCRRGRGQFAVGMPPR